jgi:L-threonylcarbamoyladenylate synthase
MARIVNIDFHRPGEAEVAMAEIRALLKSGGVIAFPTDTFYGLGVDPLNPAAVDRIYAIKNRPAYKPILVLIDSPRQVDELASDVSSEARRLMQAFWPGPLTLLFKARPHLPRNLTAGSGKIGLRLPASEFALQLIRRVGHPLTAPSANRSGSENVNAAPDVSRALGDVIDLVVDGGPTRGVTASTILDATVSPPELVREGALDKTRIENFLRGASTAANNG